MQIIQRLFNLKRGRTRKIQFYIHTVAELWMRPTTSGVTNVQQHSLYQTHLVHFCCCYCCFLFGGREGIVKYGNMMMLFRSILKLNATKPVFSTWWLWDTSCGSTLHRQGICPPSRNAPRNSTRKAQPEKAIKTSPQVPESCCWIKPLLDQTHPKGNQEISTDIIFKRFNCIILTVCGGGGAKWPRRLAVTDLLELKSQVVVLGTELGPL